MSNTAIKQLIEEFASKDRMGNYFLENATEQFLFIRPSGNPIDAVGFGKMFSTGDLTIQSSELIKIHRLDAFDQVAFAVFTMKGSFTYQGQTNDDSCAISAFFKNIDGTWKFDCLQRSSGTTDLTSWD